MSSSCKVNEPSIDDRIGSRCDVICLITHKYEKHITPLHNPHTYLIRLAHENISRQKKKKKKEKKNNNISEKKTKPMSRHNGLMIWVIVGGGCWCGLCRVVVEVVATAIGHVMGFSWIVIGLVTNHWAYQIPSQSPPKSHSPSPSLIWIHTFAAAKVGPAFIIISQCHHDFVKFQSLSSLSHVLQSSTCLPSFEETEKIHVLVWGT